MKCKGRFVLLILLVVLLIVIYSTLYFTVIQDEIIPFFPAKASMIFSSYFSGYEIPSFQLNEEEYRKSVPGIIYDPIVSDAANSNIDIDMFALKELLTNWNPSDVSKDKWIQSPAHYSTGKGIPRFDYTNKKDLRVAELYRTTELPFIVYNVPDVNEAMKDNFNIQSLRQNFGSNIIHVDQSINNNRFTYYKETNPNDFYVKTTFPDWEPPQKPIAMTFDHFLSLSSQVEKLGPDMSNQTLHYFTISATLGYELDWIRQSFPFFQPVPSFFIVDPDGFKGINCRFGQKGVIATAHYDGGRNFVAMIRGRKRYILLPPDECKNLHLLPRGHPSARHSDIDWSNISEISSHPEIWNAKATEVMLSPGDVLYIPAYWFHYIISQDTSIQCNARSGASDIGREYITECGFYDSPNAQLSKDTISNEQDTHKSKHRKGKKSKLAPKNIRKRHEI